MANTKSNIVFHGKDTEIIISNVYQSSTFVESGIRIIDGVKSKYTWHDLKLDGDIYCGDDNGCPHNQGEIELVQNTGAVCQYHFSGEIEHKYLVATLREKYLDFGTHRENSFNDAVFRDKFLAMLVDSLKDRHIYNLLYTNAYALCDCPGLTDQFEDNTLSRPVPNGQLLTQNVTDHVGIQGELWRVIDAMPAKFSETNGQYSNPKLYVSNKIFKLLKRSLQATAPASFVGAQGLNPNVIDFAGYEVVMVPQLKTNEMFFTSPDNIAMLTDMESDINNVSIVDLLPTQNCLKYSYRVDWRGGIMFGDGEGVVYYR